MTQLRDQLQATLSGSYTIERDLGGGGMSRVFLSTETGLDRRVVLKVLPPELASGVSIERFKREISLAAKLQHAHIDGVAASKGGVEALDGVAAAQRRLELVAQVGERQRGIREDGKPYGIRARAVRPARMDASGIAFGVERRNTDDDLRTNCRVDSARPPSVA